MEKYDIILDYQIFFKKYLGFKYDKNFNVPKKLHNKRIFEHKMLLFYENHMIAIDESIPKETFKDILIIYPFRKTEKELRIPAKVVY